MLGWQEHAHVVPAGEDLRLVVPTVERRGGPPHATVHADEERHDHERPHAAQPSHELETVVRGAAQFKVVPGSG